MEYDVLPDKERKEKKPGEAETVKMEEGRMIEGLLNKIDSKLDVLLAKKEGE